MSIHMYLRGIIVSAALLSFIAGGRAKPQCAFSIPALLKSGEMVQGCLEVVRHSEPVDVNIILEVNGVNYTITNEQIPAENTFKCLEFQVPTVTKAAPVFLTVTAVSTNFDYSARRPVVVAPTGKVTLIQLNKSIYKPGEKVKFNVITLDNNLIPVEGMVESTFPLSTYPLIYVTDPSGNRLFEWIYQKSYYGIFSLSFDILDDPVLGQYTIHVERVSEDTVSKPFTVDEYVLPNFEIELSIPNSITILDKVMSFKISARFTYGLPVPGKVSARMCRTPSNFYPGNACNRSPDGLCIPITGALDSNGTFSGEVDLTPLQLDRSGYSMSITMQATVIEEGSGIQMQESKVIGINNQLGRVYFNRENMEPYYKKGLPYYVEVTAKDGRDSPLSDEIIELQIDGKTVMNLTTDANGKAKVFIDTSEMDQPTVSMQVNYKNSEQCYDSNFVVPTYYNDYYSMTRSYSRSGSFVQIDRPKEELQCGETYNLTAKYIFSQSGLQEGETKADFSYMIMSRTKITDSGKMLADLSQSLQGELSISIKITPEHAPGIDVIVYYMLEKEVVTSTMHLKTEKCFLHDVSLTFSQPKGKPGSTVDLEVQAETRSIVCAVRVYDSSLLLLQPDQPLTPEMVYASLKYNSLNGYYFEGYNVAPPDPPCIDPNKQMLIDGLYYSPVEFQNEEDTSQQFSNVGILFFTNTTLKKPTLCGRNSFIPRQPIFLSSSAGFASNLAFASPALEARPEASFAADSPNIYPAVVSSVRDSFPDTWFFDQFIMGESGYNHQLLEVPGTITEWKGDMFCLHPTEGFGMTKYPANFTSFQDFFVSESLPYSIVRGEIMIIKIIASNYLPRFAQVRAGISPSEDYTVEAMDEEDVKCIGSGERATFSFKMNAKSVGVVPVNITGETNAIGDSCDGPFDPSEPKYQDTVKRSLIVEVEGVPNEVTKSTLVCVNGTNEAIPVTISLPENSVEDAVKAKVILIGDIVGRAMVNPEALIKEPKGCGEQNLATLMPIALVLEYLSKTGRLTEDMRSRAVQYMGEGYRRQLRYLNYDGSFSPFGPGRSEGSSWLTLMTLITFERIKPYTMVEERIANQGLLYLERLKDKATGGYKPRGNVFNAELRGGADGDVSFTAAMAAYLLEAPYAAAPTLVREAMSFLDAASRREQSTYNMGLLLYTFRVAENEERSNAMYNKLKELQIEEEGTIHWESSSKPKQLRSSIFSPQASSGDIETTAYILLALATGKSPPPADLSYMSQIALWLSQQQNAYGSYSTTSDTVVALQALCRYGEKVYQKDANNTVEVKSGDALVKEFNLDSLNRNLLQTHPLPNVPGDYTMTVNGNGCVLVQTTVNYNTPVNEEGSAFLLSVSVPPESCVDGVAYTLPVSMNVSYNGPRNTSNIAVIDMDLPSGYTVEYQSLVELKSKVPKVIQKNNHIIIYLESVSRDPISLKLTLTMKTRVQNLQAKNIYVWDIYEKGENGRAILRHPCSTQ